jgi:hypothetical protein
VDIAWSFTCIVVLIANYVPGSPPTCAAAPGRSLLPLPAWLSASIKPACAVDGKQSALKAAVQSRVCCTVQKAEVLSHMPASVRPAHEDMCSLGTGCAGTCTAAGSPCAVAAAAVAAAVSAACDSFSFSRSNSKAAAPQQGCDSQS